MASYSAPQHLSVRRSHIFAPSSSHMARNHSQLDEGFSEETRSLSDSDMMYSNDLDANHQQLLAMVLDLPADQRKRTSSSSNLC